MKQNILTMKKLTVGYGSTEVLTHLDLCIQPGEILTLIGPNGAGKSTLLKTIAHQLKPLAGSVLLEEQDLSDMNVLELARKMAVVFPNALQPEKMTCREAVAAGRYPYTGRFGTLSEQDEAVITRAMEQVHVRELEQVLFTEISDGQRQRVVLARALAQEPDIILLDEPTSFLDIKWKVEFLSALQELSRSSGLTVVLTLHELDLAKQVSDRVACVKEHRLDRVDTPERIFTGTYLPELFDMDLTVFQDWFISN